MEEQLLNSLMTVKIESPATRDTLESQKGQKNFQEKLQLFQCVDLCAVTSVLGNDYSYHYSHFFCEFAIKVSK